MRGSDNVVVQNQPTAKRPASTGVEVETVRAIGIERDAAAILPAEVVPHGFAERAAFALIAEDAANDSGAGAGVKAYISRFRLAETTNRRAILHEREKLIFRNLYILPNAVQVTAAVFGQPEKLHFAEAAVQTKNQKISAICIVEGALTVAVQPRLQCVCKD